MTNVSIPQNSLFNVIQSVAFAAPTKEQIKKDDRSRFDYVFFARSKQRGAWVFCMDGAQIAAMPLTRGDWDKDPQELAESLAECDETKEWNDAANDTARSGWLAIPMEAMRKICGKNHKSNPTVKIEQDGEKLTISCAGETVVCSFCEQIPDLFQLMPQENEMENSWILGIDETLKLVAHLKKGQTAILKDDGSVCWRPEGTWLTVSTKLKHFQKQSGKRTEIGVNLSMLATHIEAAFLLNQYAGSVRVCFGEQSQLFRLESQIVVSPLHERDAVGYRAFMPCIVDLY